MTTIATINHTNISMDHFTSVSMNKIFNYELFKVDNQNRDDVKQECIARILDALSKKSVTEDKFPSYCQTIIKRAVVDYYRYANRKVEKNADTVFFCDGFVDSDNQETETFYVESDEHGYGISDVRADFEANRGLFTPTEQMAIEHMLSDYVSMSMSLSDIAKELKINKSHTTRAFNKLRDMYSSDRIVH